MIVRTQQIIYIFFLGLSLNSCGQDVLVGKWKPISFGKDKPIDLAKPDSIKKVLMRGFLENNSQGIDTTAALKQVDLLLQLIQSASLEIKDDLSFVMINNGIIVKNSPYGWHFGGTITGKWKKEKDKLVLTADNKDKFTIEYQIQKLETNSLILEETLYGKEKSSNQVIVFSRV